MTDEICNRTSESLIATTEAQTFEANQIVVEERDYELYESCHYTIEVPEYTYMDGAILEITVNSLNSSSLYIYEGTDRHNASALVEANATAVVGAPYHLPASSKAVLVMQTIPGGGTGSGSFSYIVRGSQYPFWEKPFLGEESWKWFAALIMTVLIPLLLLVLLIVCICRCCSDEKNKVEAQPEEEGYAGNRDGKVGTAPDNQIKFSEYSEDDQRPDFEKRGEELESIDDEDLDQMPATQ